MSDWWARHTGAHAPAQQPQAQPQRYYQPPPAPLPPPQRTRVPQSALGSGICPSCGSGEYMAAPGSTYKRCFSCGYPLQQSGSGISSSSGTGPAKHATQVPTSGYHPSVIVGRVE